MPDVAFGFVAICLSEKNCSPAGNVSVKSVTGLKPPEIQSKIVRTAARNIENTTRIMHFLRGHDLELYRLSANLIPLATHPLTDGWAWWEDQTLQPALRRLGEFIRKYHVRVSSHLPQVCVLSTPDPSVLEWLLRYTQYHRKLFEAMDLDEQAKLILHIGGAYNDPAGALLQAEDNFHRLDPWAQRRLVLENDDRSFSAQQVVDLSSRLKVPVAFDYHHHIIRNDGEDLDKLLLSSFSTWNDRPPKVHLSSPRSASQRRAHADYVDWEFVAPFFSAVHRLKPPALDVMIEAKQKDLALFVLQESYRKQYPTDGTNGLCEQSDWDRPTHRG